MEALAAFFTVLLGVCTVATSTSKITIQRQVFNIGTNAVATVQDTSFTQLAPVTVGANSNLLMKNLTVQYGGSFLIGTDSTACFTGTTTFEGRFGLGDHAYFNMAPNAIAHAENGVDIGNGAFVDLKGKVNVGLATIGAYSSFQVSEGGTYGAKFYDDTWAKLLENATIKVDGIVSGRNVHITANDNSGIHISGAVSGDSILLTAGSNSSILVHGNVTGNSFNVQVDEGALIVNNGGVIDSTTVHVQLGSLEIASGGNITGRGTLIVLGSHVINSTLTVPVGTFKFLYSGEPTMTKPNAKIAIDPPNVPSEEVDNELFRLYTLGVTMSIDGPACVTARDVVPNTANNQLNIDGTLRMSANITDCISPQPAIFLSTDEYVGIGSNSLLEIIGAKSMLTVTERAIYLKIGQTSILTVTGNYRVPSPMSIPDRTQKNLVWH